jgi:hypothetical protein
MNSILPGSWSHWLFPRFPRSTQFVWFLTAGYLVISSHALPTLLEPEPLILTNSLWMRRNVRCESRHIFAAYVHIVLVSHGDTTSIISRYITCSSICALASISDLGFGMMMGKGNQGPADQAVRPETSRTPLVQQPPIVTRRAGSSHSRIRGRSSAATTAAAPCSLVQRLG